MELEEAEGNTDGGESDSALGCRIREELHRYVFYTIHDDVTVSAADGVARLEGWVTSKTKADQIAEMVARVSGIREVKNEIEVLAGSPSERRARSEIATWIYTDPVLKKYAFQAANPIRIIVDEARVILRGNVRSEREKRRAERIAQSKFRVLWVVNELRVESDSTDASCRC